MINFARRMHAQRVLEQTADRASQALAAGQDPQQIAVYVEHQCKRLNRLGFTVSDDATKVKDLADA